MKKILLILVLLLSYKEINNFNFKHKPKIYKTNKDIIKYYVDIYSKKYKVNKIQIYAQIDLESEFIYNLKNDKSTAYGLPQFLKGTGNWVYKKIYPNKKYYHYDTTIGEQIEMMCWYLNYLNKKYDYNKRKVLIEYSGGTKGYVKAYLKREKKYKNI